MSKPEEPLKEQPTFLHQELQQIEKDYRTKVQIVTARPVLSQAFFFAWMVFDALLLTIFVGYSAYYLVSGAFDERRQVSAIINNLETLHDAAASRAAVSLVTGEVLVFSPTSGYEDFYTEIRNPNQDWTAAFTYSFKTSSGESRKQKGFVMPGERKPLLALHEALTGNRADLLVEEITWIRVDHHVIPDITEWLERHNDFQITDNTYVTNLEINKQKVARSSFTITNQSPYGYYEAPFLVFLLRGDTVVGVNQVVLNTFNAGEARQVDVNWFGAFPTAAEIQVVPNIDYFDADAYLPIGGEVPPDILMWQSRMYCDI
jgi:hypothetical protein